MEDKNADLHDPPTLQAETEPGTSDAVTNLAQSNPPQAYQHGRCHRCCKWFCDLTTPSCKCFSCLFCLMLFMILILVLVIKYLQWRLKHGGTVWTALLGTMIG